MIVRTNCARCHAIDKVSESPLKVAPPFRTLHLRYPIESLEEPLAEGSSPAIQPSGVPVRSRRSGGRRQARFTFAGDDEVTGR